ncbi:MAG: GIY-YIG nuclease family protein [Rudaea sp.]
MNLATFLAATGTILDPANTKIHFAVAPDTENNPLIEFQRDRFKAFQESQTRKNFERRYILSLIQFGDRSTWLYAGLYEVKSVSAGRGTAWHYDTDLAPGQDTSLIGRVVVRYTKEFRASYPAYETCGTNLELVELRKNRVRFRDFSGYKRVLLTKDELDLVISQNLESWHSALASVQGVYVIVDTSTGRSYVGSAYGENGFWARWLEYSSSGHGGDIELVALLDKQGKEHIRHFQYSILEVCEPGTSKEQVIARESHWKEVLCTRTFGLNSN